MTSVTSGPAAVDTHQDGIPALTDPDDPVALFRALLRTVKRVRLQATALLAEYDLTGAQFGTLSRIPPDGLRLTELAERAWVDPGNLSGVVDRLEREGLVERVRSREDRRAVVVRLTDRGGTVVADVTPRHRALVARIMADTTPAGRRCLLTELCRIDATATKLAAGEPQ